MTMLLVKYLLSAAVIVAVSEVAKHSDRTGALIASLPMVTIMALIWLHLEGAPSSKLANHAWYTFWYVLPTLPMFALFPLMIGRWGFWLSLILSAFLTAFLFAALGLLVKRFGVELW